MVESKSHFEAVKTTKTSFRILECIKEQDGAGVSEIANHLDIAKSTTHRHLQTLESLDYIVNIDGTYRVGLKFLEIGEYARRREQVSGDIQNVVSKLAEETGERAAYLVEEHGQVVYLARGMGEQAIKTNSQVGTRRYMHTIAAGKAILAMMPREEVEAIIDEWGLPQKTENTITGRDDLFEELDEIRDQGYAFNIEECIPGLVAVAAPIVKKDETVIGSLTISGPVHRIKGDRLKQELPDLLLGTTNDLALRMEFEY